MTKKSKIITSDKAGIIETPESQYTGLKVAKEPCQPYARMSWCIEKPGAKRPTVDATGYAMNESEWKSLRSYEFDQLREYLQGDSTRRKQAVKDKATARKLESARKEEADAKAKREALEQSIKTPEASA